MRPLSDSHLVRAVATEDRQQARRITDGTTVVIKWLSKWSGVNSERHHSLAQLSRLSNDNHDSLLPSKLLFQFSYVFVHGSSILNLITITETGLLINTENTVAGSMI